MPIAFTLVAEMRQRVAPLKLGRHPARKLPDCRVLAAFTTDTLGRKRHSESAIAAIWCRRGAADEL